MIEWYYLVLVSATLMGFSSVLEKYMLKQEHASAYSASFSIMTAVMALVFLPFAEKFDCYFMRLRLLLS